LAVSRDQPRLPSPIAGFRVLEDAWMEGVAAMARAGARIIIDDAFLGGAASQQR